MSDCSIVEYFVEVKLFFKMDFEVIIGCLTRCVFWVKTNNGSSVRVIFRRKTKKNYIENFKNTILDTNFTYYCREIHSK